MITSIDHYLAQQIVETVKDVCGQNVNFIDKSGVIFASTDENRIGMFHQIGLQVAQSGTTIEVTDDHTYPGTRMGINLPIYHNKELLAVVGITGEPEEIRKYARLAERIAHLLLREKEISAFSKTQTEKKFYIIDHLLHKKDGNANYLNSLLEEFSINSEIPKRLVMICLNSRYNPVNHYLIEPLVESVLEQIPSALWMMNYPNEYLVLLDDSEYSLHKSELLRLARQEAEVLKITVGKACQLFNLSASEESARAAYRSIRDTSDCFAVYDDLTFELVLSSMKKETQEHYLEKTISKLTEKEQHILDVYFQMNCSLSATAEALFLHKNTLQYQLNHIHQLCGLNPRDFKDAVLLYIGIELQKK